MASEGMRDTVPVRARADLPFAQPISQPRAPRRSRCAHQIDKLPAVDDGGA
jgi:hypothetical protein